MKHTLTIAAREIRDTSFLFIAAAVLALIPFLAFLPLRSSGNAREAVAIFGFVVASNFAIVVAIMVGASLVGRELTEKRLSFYFSRPIGAASIWFGKLTAAVLMTVAAYAIIAVPAALASARAWQSTWPMSPIQSVGLAAAIGLLIVLVAHTISTGVRSRSALVFADLVGIGVTSVAVWLIIRPLVEGMAAQVLKRYALAFAIGAGLILIAAGAWQMSRGRIDAKRNHFELSKFIWTAMAVFLVVLAAFTAWFTRVAVPDLVVVSGGEQAAHGPWSALTGTYRGRGDYRPVLLYDMQHGRSMRMSGLPWQVKLSNDGRSVVWTRPLGFGIGRREVCITTLGETSSTAGTGIAVWPNGTFLLSDDGRQLAVLEGKNLSVHDVSRHRLIGSVRLPLQNPAMYFVAPNRVRLISRWRPDAPASAGPEGIYVAEFDAGAKTVTHTGRLDFGESKALFGASADGSRLLVNRWAKGVGRDVLLLDARTAAVIADLGKAGAGFAARFLADGRIVTAGSFEGRVTVHLFTADGVPLRGIDAGNADGAYGPVVLAPNRIALLETHTLADQSRKPAIVIVDLDRGVVGSIPDLWPAEGYMNPFYEDDPRLFVPEPNRPLLLTDRKATLWKWNPATGQKIEIAGE